MLSEYEKVFPESDLFKCNTYNCTLLKKRCIERQELARDVAIENRYYKCQHCIQGEGIRKAYAMVVRPPILFTETYKKKEDEMMDASKTCKVDGCYEPQKARELCSKHYDKWRNGDQDVIKVMGGEFNRIRPKSQKARKIKLPRPNEGTNTPGMKKRVEADKSEKVKTIERPGDQGFFELDLTGLTEHINVMDIIFTESSAPQRLRIILR